MEKALVILTFFLVFLKSDLWAQTNEVGVDIGLNNSSVIVASNQILGRQLYYNSLIGYLITVHLTYQTEKATLKFPLSFENRRVIDVTTTNYTDATGNVLGQYKNIKQSNRFFCIGAVYVLEPATSIKLGIGPKINYLVNSVSYPGSFQTIDKLSNLYFKKLNVSLLFECYYYLQTFGLFFKIENDLLSRLPALSALKEYGNTISVGITYSRKKH